MIFLYQALPIWKMIKLQVSISYFNMVWNCTKSLRNSPIGKEIGTIKLQFNRCLTVICIRFRNLN